MKKQLCAVLACSLLLSGCKSSGRQIRASFDTDIYKDYMTETNRIDSLNYLVTDKEKNMSLLGNLVDGLVETDRYGNLKPALAQDVGVADETYTVWDFSIRGEVPWVNFQGEDTGYDVTADDFLCGIEYVLNNENASMYQNQVASLISNGSEYLNGSVSFDEVGVEAINEYTLRFTLKEACPYFNTYLLNGGFYPVNRALLNETQADFATSAQTMWYNGAYYLTGYDEEKITFEKNESYWEVGQVSFDEGSIVLVENEEEALDFFKSGKLSYSFIDEEYAEKKKSSLDMHMYMSAISPETYAYVYNFTSDNENFQKAVKNDAFRQALFSGLNVSDAFLTEENDVENDQVEKTVSNQLNVSAQSTIIPNGFATKNDGSDYVSLGSLAKFSGKSNYDEEKSAELQKQAIQELTAEGVVFPIEIRVPISIKQPQDTLEFTRMTSNFDSTFVKFTPINYSDEEDNQEISTLTDILSSNRYEMICVSIGAENGDPSTYLGKLTSQGKLNATYSHFTDEVYDGLYASANTFSDYDQRLMSFAECEAYLLNKAYVIPFSHGQLSYKVSSINDYSMPSGTYGLARFKLKGVKASEKALTINERAELKAAYEEAKSSAI